MSSVSGGIFRARPFVGPIDGPGGLPLRAVPLSPTIEEAWALVDLVRGLGGRPLVLEVGTAFGYSSILMAHAGATVTTVDPHLDHESWDGFQANVRRHKMLGRVWPIVGRSADVLPQLEASRVRFDAAFVDGDHSYEAALEDLELARRLLRPGQEGILAAHDYGANWPSVREAGDEFLRRHSAEVLEAKTVETLLVLRLAAPRAGGAP